MSLIALNKTWYLENMQIRACKHPHYEQAEWHCGYCTEGQRIISSASVPFPDFGVVKGKGHVAVPGQSKLIGLL